MPTRPSGQPDWSNPIARGLTRLYGFTEGSGRTTRDSVAGTLGTLADGSSWRSSPFGGGVLCDDNSGGGPAGYISLPPIDTIRSDGLSFFLAFYPKSWLGYTGRRGFLTIGSGGNIVQIVRWEDGNFYVGDPYITVSSYPLIREQAINTIVLSMASPQDRKVFYINGIKAANTTNSTPGYSASPLQIGIYGGASMGGVMLASAFWNRGLSDGEAVSLHADPFQLFRRTTDRSVRLSSSIPLAIVQADWSDTLGAGSGDLPSPYVLDVVTVGDAYFPVTQFASLNESLGLVDAFFDGTPVVWSDVLGMTDSFGLYIEQTDGIGLSESWTFSPTIAEWSDIISFGETYRSDSGSLASGRYRR